MKLRFIPLSLLKILCSCFSCQVLEGYGMTESACVISAMNEGDSLIGHVGSPNPACGELFSWIGYSLFLIWWNTSNTSCVLSGTDSCSSQIIIISLFQKLSLSMCRKWTTLLTTNPIPEEKSVLGGPLFSKDITKTKCRRTQMDFFYGFIILLKSYVLKGSWYNIFFSGEK